VKILVIGAGAIGGFVGGMLAYHGHQVTLLGRPAPMQQLAQTGLTIQYPQRPPLVARPQTISQLIELPHSTFDFILLTVKAPDVAQAIAQLQTSPLTIDQTYLVSLQNGLGSEELLAAAFGHAKIIAATITIPIQVPQPGLIEISKVKGGLGLAPLSAMQAAGQAEALANALSQAGLPTVIYPDCHTMKWSKLLLNIINNATAAILDEPPAQIIARPELFNLEIAALREAYQVMRALGLRPVKLPGYPTQWLGRLLATTWLHMGIVRAIMRPFMVSGRGNKMPSLHLDLAAGRRTSEIMFLNGAIVQAGRKVGIATPVNQALTTILSGIVSGELKWADYQHQPNKLLAAVRAKTTTD